MERRGFVGRGEFEGRVVLVSGGATGIGAATARAFAVAGAATVVADVNEAAGGELVGALVEAGGIAEFAHCDVACEEDVFDLFEWVARRYGEPDVVVANAGVEWTKDARHTTLEEWNRVLAINLTGVFLVGRSALSSMCARGDGAVVVTGSPHATATVADTCAYAASKGGVHALVRALALEAAPSGVRVNGLVPGTIDTPMVRREAESATDPAASFAAMAAAQPLGRAGRPEEVAEVALFLASTHARFVTGALYAVDGGLTAALPSGPPMTYNA